VDPEALDSTWLDGMHTPDVTSCSNFSDVRILDTVTGKAQPGSNTPIKSLALEGLAR
jgi:hypothetical protein